MEELLDKSGTELMQLFNARQRRRLSRGLNVKVRNFIQKLRKAKTGVSVGDKPVVVKTHLRNQIVMPEMVGSVAGVYNGKVFNSVEIKVSALSMILFSPIIEVQFSGVCESVCFLSLWKRMGVCSLLFFEFKFLDH